MGEKTGISWTDHTFNPWIGCTKVSAGCANCYAENLMDHRWGIAKWGRSALRVKTSRSGWLAPLRWNKAAAEREVRARVFCSSLADVFEDNPQVSEWRSELWDLIHRTTWLDWQLLTKRPENIAWMLPVGSRKKLWNVWLGTSVEDQESADTRIPRLLVTPSRVHFVSMEPMLGPIDLSNLCMEGGGRLNAVDRSFSNPPLDWVIVGGESGAKARPFNLDWARGVRDDCKSQGVAFFMKQVGCNPIDGGSKDLDCIKHGSGADPEEWPEDLRIQEFPR